METVAAAAACYRYNGVPSHPTLPVTSTAPASASSLLGAPLLHNIHSLSWRSSSYNHRPHSIKVCLHFSLEVLCSTLQPHLCVMVALPCPAQPAPSRHLPPTLHPAASRRTGRHRRVSFSWADSARGRLGGGQGAWRRMQRGARACPNRP